MNPPIRIILERLVENVIELFGIIYNILECPVRLLEVNKFIDWYIAAMNRECVPINDWSVVVSRNPLLPAFVGCVTNLELHRFHHIREEIVKRLLEHILSCIFPNLLTPLLDRHAPVMNLAAAHGATTIGTLEVPSLDTRLAKLVSAHKCAIGGILVAHWALHYRLCFYRVCNFT